MQGAGSVTIGGANMWALLLDKDPGNSASAGDLAVDVVHRKLKKTAAAVPVEVAKPANRGNMAKKEKQAAAAGEDKRAANVHEGKVQINGAVGKKQAPVVATVPDGDKLTDGREEITETLPALRSKEEVKEEVFEVVAARGGRRRTVAAQTRKEAAAPVAVVTGTNMWALLSDDDPGHGGANQAKRAKKTKTKKKNTAGDSHKAATTMDCEEETPASELDKEMSEEEEEMTDQAATGCGLCWTVASFVFKAAAIVAVLASMSIVLEIGYL